MTPNQSFRQSLEIKHDQLMDQVAELALADRVLFRRFRIKRINFRIESLRYVLSSMAMLEMQQPNFSRKDVQ